MKHTVADGKYTIMFENGTLKGLRNGEPWERDLVGDNLIYWMLVEIDRLKADAEREVVQPINNPLK